MGGVKLNVSFAFTKLFLQASNIYGALIQAILQKFTNGQLANHVR